MKEPKFYVEISVEKELPKEQDNYWVLESGMRRYRFFYKKENKFHSSHEAYAVTHWLKPFSLPELMEDFPNWLYNNTMPNSRNLNGYWLFITPGGKYIRKNSKELMEEYLTQKGILTKDSGFFDEEF